jgi:hypothetical protein
LENPQKIPGNPFPTFDYLQDKKVEVYSTYSYGDNLNNEKFGTLDNAQVIICDEPKRQTLCLDMPCVLRADGNTAECYCQNTAAATEGQQCDEGSICPQFTMWNTLSDDCNTNNCDPGEGRIRSAAYIYQTMLAIAALHVSISNKDPLFKDVPSYCR